MKYRIECVEYENGDTYYYVQEKVFFVWVYLRQGYLENRLRFSNLKAAQQEIKHRRHLNRKPIKTLYYEE